MQAFLRLVAENYKSIHGWLMMNRFGCVKVCSYLIRTVDLLEGSAWERASRLRLLETGRLLEVAEFCQFMVEESRNSEGRSTAKVTQTSREYKSGHQHGPL